MRRWPIGAACAVVLAVSAVVVASGSLPLPVVMLTVVNLVVLAGLCLLLVYAVAGRGRACERAERAEAEARESNSRLFQVIDNTSAVIYLRDRDGRYILVNRQYEALFDVKRENVVGLTDHDLFPTPIADGFRANDLKALASPTAIQMEETAPHADGLHTYVTVKYPITNAAGEPVAVCGISTDITDLKRAEEEVRRLNAELEQRVLHRTTELEASTRELDAFAYSVSHDLRAPLRALDGFSQVLVEDYHDALDETGRDYLRRIQAATVRMGQLIDDLLDLSRATRVEISREPVDLRRIAGELIDELRTAEPDREVQIEVADPLIATGDPHLLRLVLQNLLGNAWKFTGRRTAGRIEVGVAEQDGVPVYFVRDNGAGFDPRYADKLFVPFQRIHSAQEFPGSGIGLAIVSRIVRRHGGEVWAESLPDQGATFSFTLTPLARAATRPAESEPEAVYG
ncbi:sensor histidine kinase [Cryptosporangium minutisporangium]